MYNATLGGFRQQTQCPVKIGFATAIGTRDDIERSQWNNQLQQGSIVGDGQGLQHNFQLQSIRVNYVAVKFIR